MAVVTRLPHFGRVFARLFALQASWNYERMQGVGFGHALEPALRGLDGGTDGARYRDALARHAKFFNAHPYFAGLAVGAVARAELDGVAPEKVDRLRTALCSPLGSVGDRLFWASWLPACSAIAILAFVFGARAWAALLFLVLYNAAHLACRAWALRAGWAGGIQVAGALNTPVLRLATRITAPLAGLLLGAAVPVLFGWQLQGEKTATRLSAIVFTAVIVVALRIVRGRVAGITLAAGVLGAIWLTGLVLW